MEESMQTISSQVSQVWHAFGISLSLQGMSAAWLGFGLELIGNTEEVLPALRAVLCLQNRPWAETAVRLAGKGNKIGALGSTPIL